jgi:hypothetical protein
MRLLIADHYGRITEVTNELENYDLMKPIAAALLIQNIRREAARVQADEDAEARITKDELEKDMPREWNC